MELKTSWDWLSHLPVTKFVIEQYDISYCLEHGTGKFSTPLLSKGCKNYLGIEEDAEFFQFMKDNGEYDSAMVRFARLPESIHIGSRFSELPFSTQEQLIYYYSDLYCELNEYMPKMRPRLLFVDGFTATRDVVIANLSALFDIIIIHDTEPNSYDHYEYNLKNQYYFEDYDIYTITTPVPYTSLMIRKGIHFDTDILRGYVDAFCDEMGWEHDKMDIIQERP